MKSRWMPVLAALIALLAMAGALAEGAEGDWTAAVLSDEAVRAEYPYHARVDVNGDGVPALLVSTTEDSFITGEDKCAVYLYADGAPAKVLEVGGEGGDIFYANLEAHTLTHFYRFSGEGHIEVYRVEDGALALVTRADHYGPFHGPTGDNREPVYFQDDAPITEAQSDALWGVYAADNAVTYAPMP